MSQMVQVVTGPLEGKSFLISADQTLSLGRSSQNDITLPYDPWISSAHVNLKSKDGQIQLMDLDSSNGSFVNGRKVPGNTFVPVTEYFILGSTLCRIDKPGPIISEIPLSTKKPAAEGFLLNPICHAAWKLAIARSSPVVSVLHLFMAILEMDREDVKRYLSSLKLDLRGLTNRLEKLRLFEGRDFWINDFMIYQFKSKQPGDCLLTPLAQNMLGRNQSNLVDPVAFLKTMLHQDFNILFPLLGISGEQKPESGATEKVTLNPYSEAYKELTLPAEFWSLLGQAMAASGPILLTGGPGSGKSAVLALCFHSLPKVDIPRLKSNHKYLFDPKAYLVYHEVGDLTSYINDMIKALRTTQPVAIDHFGYLIRLASRKRIELTPLIRAIKKRHDPVLLGVGSADLAEVEKLVATAETAVISLDAHAMEVCERVGEGFLIQFESETKRRVSEGARAWLHERLFPLNDFGQVRTFFDICAERVSGMSSQLNPSPGEDAANDTREISSSFFEMMASERLSPTAHREAVITAPTLPAPHRASAQTVTPATGASALGAALEATLQQFLRTQMSSDLIYSDGSNGLTQKSELSDQQKEAELIDYLETLLECFQAGFAEWLDLFLTEVDPHQEKETADPIARWTNMIDRFELLNKNFIHRHFLDLVRKNLRRCLKEKSAQSRREGLKP